MADKAHNTQKHTDTMARITYWPLPLSRRFIRTRWPRLNQHKLKTRHTHTHILSLRFKLNVVGVVCLL